MVMRPRGGRHALIRVLEKSQDRERLHVEFTEMGSTGQKVLKSVVSYLDYEYLD
jgi:hypothetical protein